MRRGVFCTVFLQNETRSWSGEGQQSEQDLPKEPLFRFYFFFSVSQIYEGGYFPFAVPLCCEAAVWVERVPAAMQLPAPTWMPLCRSSAASDKESSCSPP